MKKLQLLKKLETFPMFTENDVAKITNKSPEYVRKLLYRANREGLIKRIERGKYTLHEDGMVFASYLSIPSYISLWSALRYYNMTQLQPYAIFVMSPVSKIIVKFQNTSIVFKKTKHMFGYKKERYADFNIFMAEREKAIIDSMLFKLPLQDIAEALNDKELDFEKLSEYAKKTKSISLMKRLGYILEKKKGNSYGLNALDNNYALLDYLGKKKGRKDRRWKLVINTML